MTKARINAALLGSLTGIPSGKQNLYANDQKLVGPCPHTSSNGLLGRHPDLPPEAAPLLAKAREDICSTGLYPASEPHPAGMTLACFALQHFLPHVEATLISHKEVETLMRLRILPALGHLKLNEITAQQVLAFRKRLIAEKLSASRINAHLAALRRAFNLAIKWQLLDGRNPAASPGMLRTEGRETFLLEPQLRALIVALEAEVDSLSAAAIMLLALTGARKSEILKAQWGQIDRERNVLTVPRSKSGRRRQIFLSDEAIRILDRLPQGAPRDFIFPSARRTGQALAGLRGTWSRVKARAGIAANVRIHDLRHTFASLLVNDGVSLYEVGKLLGHTQPSTTARYAHVRDDRQLEAVNAVARKVGPKAVREKPAGEVRRGDENRQASIRRVAALLAAKRALAANQALGGRGVVRNPVDSLSVRGTQGDDARRIIVLSID